MRNKVRAFASENWAYDAIELRFITDDGRGKKAIMTDAVFTSWEEGLLPPDEVPLMLKKEDAIELMNSLWNIGIRPRGMQATSETIKAKDEHIEDLRSIMNAFIAIKS